MHSKFLRVGRVGSGTREPEKGVSANSHVLFFYLKDTAAKMTQYSRIFCFVLFPFGHFLRRGILFSQPVPPTLGVQCLNHWTTREVSAGTYK